jgi:HK97 family phage major capsid protein
MQMSDGKSGGIAVPEQFREEILMVGAEAAIMRPGCTVIPAGDPPDAKVTMPALDQSRGIHGGVEVTWVAEGGEKPQTDAKLLEVSLEPKEVAGHVVVTDKLLRNWQAAGPLLRKLLRGAVRSAEDLAFIRGNGVGKPLGYQDTNCGATIVVSRNTGSKVLFADIGGMLEALHPESMSDALWIAHQTTLSQLMALKDENGNSIFIRGDITKGLPNTLGGIPIRFTGKTAPLGSKGDLALIDRNYYLIKDGSGPFIAASEHVYFKNNKTVIKIFWNVDGHPWLQGPLTLEDEVTQVSPFVVLE